MRKFRANASFDGRAPREVVGFELMSDTRRKPKDSNSCRVGGLEAAPPMATHPWVQSPNQFLVEIAIKHAVG